MSSSEFFSILLVAIALAMDSFTVSISGGASLKKPRFSDALIVATYFGVFQGIMTLLGWQGGLLFSDLMSHYAPWIAAGLLLVIGAKMLWESFKKEEEEEKFSLSHKLLLVMALATSIDAFGVGLGYALLDAPVLIYSIIIALTAFIFSGIGVYLGKSLKSILGKKAETVGGLILVGMGINMAWEHLTILI